MDENKKKEKKLKNKGELKVKNMGWSNYLILPKLKLAIEISRHTEELEEYRRYALEEAIGEESIDLDEMDQVKLTEITLKDLTVLYTAYDRMQRIAGMEYDKLLLFWLEHRDIDYEVKSEHQVNIDEYKKKGYKIIRIFQDNEDKEEIEDGGDKINKEIVGEEDIGKGKEKLAHDITEET